MDTVILFVTACAATEARRVEVAAVVQRTAPEHGTYRQVLAVDPAVAKVFATWFPDIPQMSQCGGDYGERLSAVLHEATRHGGRAIVIGMESLEIDRETLAEAFAALETFDLVVGPTPEGGYYLLGGHRAEPRLFEGIAWGTETVCAALLARATAGGVRTALLRPRGGTES
ncbi:MAG: DUF2064 domain-containing protein [Deltaproteobacteria bacterium]|nr:DUF2064 domain-containing protein [Deltaproteobacteria bacterium]